MKVERAGGGRRKTAINPPAVYFPRHRIIDIESSFSPKAEPPAVMDGVDLLKRLSADGVKDAMTDQAAAFLDLAGYQRVMRYLPDDEKDKNLETARSLMMLDLEFQSMLMKHIGFFEIAFRSKYSTTMAEARGPFAHRNPKNFSDAGFYEEFLTHYADELTRSASRSRRIREEVDTFGDIPLWSAVDSMTFGTLSKLYKNTRSRAIKDKVAGSFGADYQTFSSWLRSLSIARNECAHFGKLLGTHLVSQPKSIDSLMLKNDNPFYLVLILAKMLCGHKLPHKDVSPLSEIMLMQDVARLMATKEHIRRLSGIPSNWRSLIKHAMSITE